MKTGRLQVRIVTLFLVLLASALILVGTYTFFRSSQAILAFSKDTAERVGTIILNHILCMTSSKEELNAWTSSFPAEDLKINADNKRLIHFLLTQAKTFPHFYGESIALMDGSFIEAGDLTMLETWANSVPGKLGPAPSETRFIIRVIDRSVEDPFDQWIYLSEDFKVLGTQTFEVSYDPRKRDWFKEALITKKSAWTDIFQLKGVPLMGVSQPIFDKQGEVIGVSISTIPIANFERFLNEEKIGKTGKAMILSYEGKLLIPTQMPTSFEKAINKAFTLYKKNQKNDFSFSSDGVRYLAYLKPFPSNFKKNWNLLILVPLEELFSTLLSQQVEVAYLSLATLIIGAFMVIYFSKRISEPIVKLSKEVDKMKHLNLEGTFSSHSRIKEILMLESSIHSTKVMLRSFGRYIPKKIVQDLMLQGKEIRLGGEKKEVTIFFSDIANFTSMAETIPSDELIPLLSEYFHLLSEIILNEKGTIDKYIGDSIMAFWGAPIENKKHGYFACLAALKCKRAQEKLNQDRATKGLPQFRTRFGLNSGLVFVGNIGTSERMNYTILGDAVNTAERLEQMSKIYHTTILVGDSLAETWDHEFLFRPIDITTVKGRAQSTKIYELLAQKKEDASLEVLTLLFTKGFEAFHRGHYEQAKESFEKCLKEFPNDEPTKIYLEKIQSKREKSR